MQPQPTYGDLAGTTAAAVLADDAAEQLRGILAPEHVHLVLGHCLFRDDELAEAPDDPEAPPELSALPDDAVIVEMIMRSYAFHPGRLEEAKLVIRAMLGELPLPFQMPPAGGGGWSFLQACVDRYDEMWTGEHRTMEALFALGTAAGLVTCPIPRDMWGALHGSMPYYAIDLEA